MGIDNYYFARNKEKDFGTVFYLKQLQEAEASTGGGAALLGSMVQWIDRIAGAEYPIPLCMSEPQGFITVLENKKSALGITKATQKVNFAGVTNKVSIDKKYLVDLGVGPFPMFPLNVGLDIDYGKMKSITITYGAGTYTEFIPIGHLVALYKHLGGKPNAKLGGDLLRKNAFINQIMVAKNYSVNFESTDKMGAGIEAKIEAINAIPEIGGKFSFSNKSQKTLTAEIKGDTYYVVGLTANFWHNLR